MRAVPGSHVTGTADEERRRVPCQAPPARNSASKLRRTYERPDPPQRRAAEDILPPAAPRTSRLSPPAPFGLADTHGRHHRPLGQRGPQSRHARTQGGGRPTRPLATPQRQAPAGPSQRGEALPSNALQGAAAACRPRSGERGDSRGPARRCRGRSHWERPPRRAARPPPPALSVPARFPRPRGHRCPPGRDRRSAEEPSLGRAGQRGAG